MTDTAQFLLEETNAKVVFSQSDEITLILYSDDRKSSIYNDGKKQKILWTPSEWIIQKLKTILNLLWKRPGQEITTTIALTAKIYNLEANLELATN